MNLKLFINVIIFLGINNFVFGQEIEKKLVQSFFKEMLSNLNKYVYKSDGYTIDFYFIEEYKINDFKDNIITVDLNTGEKLWTRVWFKFIKDEKDNLYFEGYISKYNNTIMTPWYKKSLIPQLPHE